MTENEILCRVLRIQKRKTVCFLYVSGFIDKQVIVERRLSERWDIGVMSVIRGKFRYIKNKYDKTIAEIFSIEECVKSSDDHSYSFNFSNASVKYCLCKNTILSEIKKYLCDEGFLDVCTPITMPDRGTSTAAPLSAKGRYVDRYCKITHEANLKKLMSVMLRPVFEVGYVTRDLFNSKRRWFEYCVLELVSPNHNIDFVALFIESVIQIACRVADDMKIPHVDMRNIGRIELDDNGRFDGIPLDQIKVLFPNVVILNSPVSSPFVKCINGRRNEVKWYYRGESMAHGYIDENDWVSFREFSEQQLSRLKEKNVDGELSWDSIETIKRGIPDSVSIGFGLDRFFNYFFGFNNMKYYHKGLD